VLPLGSIYEVFASNNLDNCNNPNHQTILCNGTGDEFRIGKACANKLNFSCYGLKVSNYSPQNYIGLQLLQFLFEDSPYVGAAFASSVYSNSYRAEKAFKMQGVDFDDRWCSVTSPGKPVLLWFQFDKPQRIIKIKFKEHYKLPTDSVYQVFASNDYDNCGNAEGHNILSSGIGDEFANGKAFENMRYFYCYGIKTSQPVNTYVSVKQLQFEAEEGGSNLHGINADSNLRQAPLPGPVQKTDGKRTGPHFQ